MYLLPFVDPDVKDLTTLSSSVFQTKDQKSESANFLGNFTFYFVQKCLQIEN